MFGNRLPFLFRKVDLPHTFTSKWNTRPPTSNKSKTTPFQFSRNSFSTKIQSDKFSGILSPLGKRNSLMITSNIINANNFFLHKQFSSQIPIIPPRIRDVESQNPTNTHQTNTSAGSTGTGTGTASSSGIGNNTGWYKNVIRPRVTKQSSNNSNNSSNEQGLPFGSKDNPMYVRKIEQRSIGSWILTFMLGATVLVVVYVTFFRPGGSVGSGGLSDLLNPTFSQVETNINVSFNDVKGSEEAKEELADIVDYLSKPQKYARLNVKLPKGVLLVGPPGTGKTLLARALAGEAGVPFLYTSGSEFEEMLVGVGARRVRSLFRKAKESSPCIIFIDEIDAIGKRDGSLEGRSKMTLNQILVEMDGFEQNAGIVVIAATNLPELLDPALTRAGRFDRKVHVTLPDVKTRQDMIDMYLGQRQAPDVDVVSLARSTTGFSGADIFNMVNSAAILAVKKNLRKIPMHLLETAKENVRMGPERKSLVISAETKKITAFHEAGHALVAVHTPLFNQVVKATLIPRGPALGMVSFAPSDELMETKQELLSHIDISMGGRVAEELVFGPEKITQGAGSDFQGATKIAETMVKSYGMSDKLGPIAFKSMKDIGDKTRDMIDLEIKNILEQSYQRAKTIISNNRDKLERLANALLEYETLSAQEIQMVINGHDIRSLKEQQKKDEEKLKEVEKKLTVIPNTSSPQPSSSSTAPPPPPPKPNIHT